MHYALRRRQVKKFIILMIMPNSFFLNLPMYTSSQYQGVDLFMWARLVENKMKTGTQILSVGGNSTDAQCHMYIT